jgi:hypothetical protein
MQQHEGPIRISCRTQPSGEELPTMLSKCANPACSAQFIYLREGRLFVMEHTGKPALRQQGPALARSASRLEHFWLCGPCSESFTLVYSIDRGVQVVAREGRHIHAAAS